MTGKFDFEEVVDLAERYYGGWEPVGFRAGPRHGDGRRRGREDLVDAKLNRQYVMGITPGPGAQDEGRFAARILSDVLGDDDNSRLYWALVDNAICEEADFSAYPHDCVGSFVLSLVCDPGRGDEALEIALGELGKVRDGLTDAEVERAKNKLAGGSVLHGESPMGRMRAIGGGWVYNGEYRSMERDLDALLAVTTADLRALLDRFGFDPMGVVTLGPSAK